MLIMLFVETAIARKKDTLFTPLLRKMTAQQFINALGIHPESNMAHTIARLEANKFKELKSVVDPESDSLIYVDESGFSVNHGNVGSKGIRYDF
jgi:hypothetical protein